MRMICNLFVLILFSSCHSQNRKITFINQSGIEIDSLLIGISSADMYAIKYTNLRASDTIVTVIPHNKPKSNKHDITVDITIYPKNHDLVYEYYYNDLAGYLINSNTIIFNGKKEIKWR